MKIILSDRNNDQKRNFRNNQSNQRNRPNKPGYRRNPAPDRASRRPRSGGFVRAKILDYRPGKEFGKLVPLEGEFKLTQIVFYKNVIDQRVEHHVYKNQEVMVLLQKENDAIEVKKMEVSVDYRPIPGEENLENETRDSQKKPKEMGSSQSSIESKPEVKAQYKERGDQSKRPVQKTERSSSGQPRRDEPKQDRSRPERKPKVEKPQEVANPLSEIEALTSEPKEDIKPRSEKKAKVTKSEEQESPLASINSLESEIKVETKPKREKKQKMKENPPLEQPTETVPETTIHSDSEVEEQININQTQPETISNDLESVESTEIKEEISSENSHNESILTQESFPDENDLDSLVNQMSQDSSKEESSNVQTETEDDMASLISNFEEPKENSTSASEISDVDDLDDLVSALSSSDSMDEDEIAKQYQALLNKSSEIENQQEEVEEEDSTYQKGFATKDQISSTKSKKSKAAEESTDDEGPKRSLKEELAAEQQEESLLEKLVGKIAVEIDEDDDEYDYEDDDNNETESSTRTGTSHFKKENKLDLDQNLDDTEDEESSNKEEEENSESKDEEEEFFTYDDDEDTDDKEEKNNEDSEDEESEDSD